jgi:hypothetical protein
VQPSLKNIAEVHSLLIAAYKTAHTCGLTEINWAFFFQNNNAMGSFYELILLLSLLLLSQIHQGKGEIMSFSSCSLFKDIVKASEADTIILCRALYCSPNSSAIKTIHVDMHLLLLQVFDDSFYVKVSQIL